ncbi:MAG: calcium-binding protein [Myxococcota bacterium]|nr:calcium-binding protein [Myxococcota bacterium]
MKSRRPSYGSEGILEDFQELMQQRFARSNTNMQSLLNSTQLSSESELSIPEIILQDEVLQTEMVSPEIPQVTLDSETINVDPVLPQIPEITLEQEELDTIEEERNAPPSIVSVYVEDTAVEQNETSVDVFFNAADPDWDPLNWDFRMSGSIERSGSVNGLDHLLASFSPKSEELVPGDFVKVEATVRDPKGESDTADVTIEVMGEEEEVPPETTPQPISVVDPEPELTQQPISVTDPEPEFTVEERAGDRIIQHGGRGRDKIFAFGTDGDDFIKQKGGRGRDKLRAFGREGDDVIKQRGGRGRDNLKAKGGRGDDVIKQRGGRGRDKLKANGGKGDDRIKMNGGRGRDSLIFAVSSGRDRAVLNGGKGRDEALIKTNGYPIILQNAKGNILYQEEGAETIITLKSIKNFSIVDQNGDILYQGGKGFSDKKSKKERRRKESQRRRKESRNYDRIVKKVGGDGKDKLGAKGKSSNDKLILKGRRGNDKLVSSGKKGNDLLRSNGGKGDDRLLQRGGKGNDRLKARGGKGDDRIRQRGGKGNDRLKALGGKGSDRIRQKGGRGADTLIAGRRNKR